MTTPNRTRSAAKLALAAAAAVTIAAFMWPKTNSPVIPVHSPLDPNLGIAEKDYIDEAAMREQQNHPVTDEMLKAAKDQVRKTAPEFSLPDGDGQTWTLARLREGGKPVLIFFIEKNCPCCLGAKHFVDRLADNFSGKASVIGIINAQGKEAETWRKLTAPHFPVLEDPNQIAIRQYAAERGVYTALIQPDGTIGQAYAGYSLAMLKDVSKRLANAAGIPDPGFESNAAPTVLTSGCLFPPVQSQTEQTSKDN